MMDHKGTRTLKTARLILRQAKTEDSLPMFANWASDPEVTRYLTWPAHERVETTRWVLDNWIQGYDSPNFYQWMIVAQEVGEAIGTISAVRIDEENGEIEVGYCIGRRWWHRGFVTEALTAVMAYLFREVGAGRISARHDPRNPNSGSVMRKCGMEYIRTDFDADRNNQGICNAAWYAMDRHKWTNSCGNSGSGVL